MSKDTNIEAMVLALVRTVDFSNSSIKMREVVSKSYLDYRCLEHKCLPDDLSYGERKVVEKILGSNPELNDFINWNRETPEK